MKQVPRRFLTLVPHGGSTRRFGSSRRFVPLLAVLTLGAAGGVWAQATDVEVDPITCWWRASAGSVRVGEPFSVTLTCAVVETQATRVIPDQSRLDPSVVQLPPFEVIGGAHGSDVNTASRRFFQYEYRLRLVAENLFGSEATVPPLQVTYHVETRAGQGEATQGRDLTYQLPALGMRIAALVPDSARDIREAPAVPLHDIDGLRLRANSLRLAAGLLMGIGALLVLAALVTAFRRGRTSGAAAEAALSPRSVLRAVQRTLSSARSESQQSGWSPETAARALTALRIAGSYALDRPVAQQRLTNGAKTLDGQLVIDGSWPRRVSTSVSGGATADTLGQALVNMNGATERLTIEELHDAVAGFTAVQYGRNEKPEMSALDDALAGGMRATERIAARHTVIADARRAMTHWATTTMSRMWRR
jgi:hypothetical protein